MTPTRIAVLGAGSWGTALAISLAHGGHAVALWARRPEAAAEMAATRENAPYLPGATIPASVTVTADLDAALDGATVCIQTGTTTELNLADYFRANKISYKPVPIESNEEARKNYLADRCDTYTTDASGLAATRASFTKPEDHLILPEIISKEPLGPVVRHGDDQWADIIRWTVFALIAAEEHGVTAANADAMAAKKTPATARLLGGEGELGKMLGLDKDWAKRAIKAQGNYAEIFERNVGTKTNIGLARGLNAHYTNGGLQYSPPFR